MQSQTDWHCSYHMTASLFTMRQTEKHQSAMSRWQGSGPDDYLPGWWRRDTKGTVCDTLSGSPEPLTHKIQNLLDKSPLVPQYSSAISNGNLIEFKFNREPSFFIRKRWNFVKIFQIRPNKNFVPIWWFLCKNLKDLWQFLNFSSELLVWDPTRT